VTIELDSTQHSTVVTCTECGAVDLADSPREGWAMGARHEERAHPELTQARDAARMNRKRNTP
jgi:hypothetical protein